MGIDQCVMPFMAILPVILKLRVSTCDSQDGKGSDDFW